MNRKSRSKADPFDREIKRAVTHGAFIPDETCYSYVQELADVEAKIGRLIHNEPARAVALYETFLAACCVKIDELDDSSGNFGQSVETLYCD